MEGKTAPSTIAQRLREAFGDDNAYAVSARLQRRGVAVSAQSIYDWLKGAAEPKEPHLLALAEEYGVTPAWLRYGVGPRDSLSAAAVELGKAVQAMAAEPQQEVLDFVAWKLSKPDVQVAEETRAGYMKFLENVRKSNARRTGGKK